MKPLKMAVIGAGQMGNKHAELIKTLDGCELVGICDVDPTRQPSANAHQVPFFQDVAELIASQRPDGAIIATPNGWHADGVEVCASFGVDVLVEKPIASTLEEAHRIVVLADETGIQVLVGHHRRFNPLVQAARTIVKDGRLGRVVAVSMIWALLKPGDYFDVDWRRHRPGGGPVVINLIHELDTLRYICGEIRQVFAHASSGVRQLEVEDTLTVSVLFENGAVGSIVASDATPSPWSYEAATAENPVYYHADENCYYFLGTSGSLAFPRMEMWHYPDPQKSGWHHGLTQTHQSVAPADPLKAQLDHFCQVIRGDEKPLIDERDGSRSLAVALAVLESLESQQPVRLRS